MEWGSRSPSLWTDNIGYSSTTSHHHGCRLMPSDWLYTQSYWPSSRNCSTFRLSSTSTPRAVYQGFRSSTNPLLMFLWTNESGTLSSDDGRHLSCDRTSVMTQHLHSYSSAPARHWVTICWSLTLSSQHVPWEMCWRLRGCPSRRTRFSNSACSTTSPSEPSPTESVVSQRLDAS